MMKEFFNGFFSLEGNKGKGTGRKGRGKVLEVLFLTNHKKP